MLQKFDASFRFFLILTATFVRSSSVYDYRVFLRQTVLAPSVSLASKGIQKGGVCEFVTKHNRYGFCRIALVGEMPIHLPVRPCSKDIMSYPELTNEPFRRSHLHSSRNALFKPRLCIITLTAVLTMFWTPVPCYLEYCSS